MTYLQRLGYIILFAKDLNESKLFYAEKLGLKIKHEAEHYVEFDLEGVKFALYSRNEMIKIVKDLRKDSCVPQQKVPKETTSK